MKRVFFLILLLVSWQQATAQKPADLSLSIIPISYSRNYSPDAVISFDYTDHFHVLLTNTSKVPVTLFEEWNSWGYFGLSFEISYPDGRTVRAVKKDRGWDKNFPSTVTIEPGGFYVFNVTLDPDIWENSLLQEKTSDHGTACRMRAIYTIEPSKYSREKHAWTGTVESPERAFIFWH